MNDEVTYFPLPRCACWHFLKQTCINNKTDYAKLLLDLGAISFPWFYIDEAIQLFNSKMPLTISSAS